MLENEVYKCSISLLGNSLRLYIRYSSEYYKFRPKENGTNHINYY